MEQLTEWTPAFDKRHKDPMKNYGIGSVGLKFILKGELGAVQFYILTGWNLPKVQEEHKIKGWSSNPMGADVGYHSPKPMYDDDTPATDSCPYLDGKPCYYDGSGLAADGLFDKFITKGIGAVWNKLENYYTDTFGELK